MYRFVQQEFANKLLVDGGDEERVSTVLSHHPQYTNVVGVLQRDKVLQHCKVRIHHIKSIEPATGIPVSGPANYIHNEVMKSLTLPQAKLAMVA